LRTIAHISDLHFGREDEAILPALRTAICAANPDIVVVSGDLTQRAKTREFQAARTFLDTLPRPQIVVPGNHDVPLYNLFARWRTPLDKYRTYVTPELAPFHSDDEIAVAGINTARSLTIKGGRINVAQAESTCARLDSSSDGVTRILVTHHPLDVGADGDTGDIVGRAAMAMTAFAQCRIDLILAGHLHESHVAASTQRYKIAGYSAILVQAGTATSVRRRGESNAWNLIRIDRPHVEIDRVAWEERSGAFETNATSRYKLVSNGWQHC